jgi:two-component system, NtrC family, response regulator AtoC
MADRGLQEVTEKLLEESATPSLVAMWEGGSLQQSLPRTGALTIGRSSECDVCIDHKTISRRHAVLHLGAGLTIEDLGSANKTKVGGVALAPGLKVSFQWREPIEVGGAVVVIRPPATLDAQPLGLFAKQAGELARMIDLVAKTDISVLLLGETGSGKGHAAAQIHARSQRASGPWLHLNCAALPEHLLEAELFGYERGAFTGAHQSKAGLLESAQGGTVFLDEVGDLPPSVQAKLLIALEHREVMRLGAVKPRPIDVRFIAATNYAIHDPSSERPFRRDLYYRLAGMPLIIPPLRERRGEIPDLVARFVGASAKKLGRSEPVLSSAALAALVGYDWPGNVRELATVIERSLLFAGDVLDEPHVRGALGDGARTPRERAPESVGEPSDEPSHDRSLADDRRELEKRRIVAALEQCSGNQSKAAQLLGIARGTLISRMDEFGLPRPRKG